MIMLYLFFMIPAIAWGIINADHHMTRISSGTTTFTIGAMFAFFGLWAFVFPEAIFIPAALIYIGGYLGIGLARLAVVVCSIPNSHLRDLQARVDAHLLEFPEKEGAWKYDADAAFDRQTIRDLQDARGKFLYWSNPDSPIRLKDDINTRLVDEVVLWLPVLAFRATRFVRPMKYLRNMIERKQAVVPK